MCIRDRNAVPIIMSGLKRLEYRGYDSAGIAYFDSSSSLNIIKIPGKINDLRKEVDKRDIVTHVAIGHTRWASRGEPNFKNAHPHTDCNSQIAIVHNGIVENFFSLKEYLVKRNHMFSSKTDSEVIAHLIEDSLQDGIEESFFKALSKIIGTYGLLLISNVESDKIIAARNGSPLLIGMGKDGYYVASDLAAYGNYTRDVLYLEDGEIAVIKADSIGIKTLDRKIVERENEKIYFTVEEIKKSGYKHFMLKEIFEQPDSIKNAYRGRIIRDEGMVKLGSIQNVTDGIKNCNRIIITACGTSWHAGLIGEYLFEEICRIPTEVEHASEFRYRDPIINRNDVFCIYSNKSIGRNGGHSCCCERGKKEESACSGYL